MFFVAAVVVVALGEDVVQFAHWLNALLPLQF
jgi:hypothetical protein